MSDTTPSLCSIEAQLKSAQESLYLAEQQDDLGGYKRIREWRDRVNYLKTQRNKLLKDAFL